MPFQQPGVSKTASGRDCGTAGGAQAPSFSGAGSVDAASSFPTRLSDIQFLNAGGDKTKKKSHDSHHSANNRESKVRNSKTDQKIRDRIEVRNLKVDSEQRSDSAPDQVVSYGVDQVGEDESGRSSNSFDDEDVDLGIGNINNIYKTLRQLRKSTLSVHNRLESILTDAEFVTTLFNTLHSFSSSLSSPDEEEVEESQKDQKEKNRTVDEVHTSCSAYETDRVGRQDDPRVVEFPLLANERCGSWYIPPLLKSGSAYFKSTDGHYGQWDFSPRRLNIPVLEVLGRHGGAVLVDSTRRGKEFPDALRRTVPIWVAVWNRLLFGKSNDTGKTSTAKEDTNSNWDPTGLQVKGLEDSEVAQIEERLDSFVDKLRNLELDFDAIKKKAKRPTLCLWIVHDEPLFHLLGRIREVRGLDLQKSETNRNSNRPGFNILILCSASKRVKGAEMSEDGYVQGAGDDSEGWSCGLSAQMFWKHKDELLRSSEEELPSLISQLSASTKNGTPLYGDNHDKDDDEIEIETVQIVPTQNVFVTAYPSDPSTQAALAKRFDTIVNCNGEQFHKLPKVLELQCRSGKLGSRDLREKLHLAEDLAKTVLKANPRSKILVTCATGKDLAVGVAAMLLCKMFDGKGQLLPVEESASGAVVVDKQLVKQRLAWITSSKPDANPSRSTLQAVNSFLMDRPG